MNLVLEALLLNQIWSRFSIIRHLAYWYRTERFQFVIREKRWRDSILQADISSVLHSENIPSSATSLAEPPTTNSSLPLGTAPLYYGHYKA